MPDNLDTPFHVHELDEELNPGLYIGGAHDAVTATLIACAAYTSIQAAMPSTSLIVAVLDDGGALQSWIGRNPVQVGL